MMMIYYILVLLAVSVYANASGSCIMRGQCDIDDLTYLPKPCVYNGPPLPLTDSKGIEIIKDLCPSLNVGDKFEVCCDANQLDDVNNSLAMLGSIFKRCPACYHNLANVFCHLICAPNQSSFIKVTEIGKNNSVDAIDYYMTEKYATGLFDSCKNVKLGPTNSSAIAIACGSHSDDCSPHLWLEYMGGHDPSPYQINFRLENTSSATTFYPMNATIVPCSDGYADKPPCLCADCPSCQTIEIIENQEH